MLKSIPRVGEQSPSLQRLTALVDNADYQLTKTVCREISEFFTGCLSNPSYLHGIQQLTSEYGKQEFLLCVDRQGQPLSIDDESIEIFRETVARCPEYKLWFRETILSKSGKSTLLIARWLCHLLGFRHTAVHLFIDHPTLTNHTLVQVRATDKSESPGCFDLPVGGHVVGTESVEETLRKELAEELGLKIDMLCELTRLSSYEYRQISASSNFRNVEYRVVFSSRLNSDDWTTRGVIGHEVAAIAMFSIIEIQKIMVDFPKRVASGLKDSFSLYLESKLKV